MPEQPVRTKTYVYRNGAETDLTESRLPVSAPPSETHRRDEPVPGLQAREAADAARPEDGPR